MWPRTMVEDDVRGSTVPGGDVLVPSKRPSSSDCGVELSLVGNPADPRVQVASGRAFCLRAEVAGIPFRPCVVQVPLSPEWSRLWGRLPGGLAGGSGGSRRICISPLGHGQGGRLSHRVRCLCALFGPTVLSAVLALGRGVVGPW